MGQAKHRHEIEQFFPRRVKNCYFESCRSLTHGLKTLPASSWIVLRNAFALAGISARKGTEAGKDSEGGPYFLEGNLNSGSYLQLPRETADPEIAHSRK
nr:unnamed protein product [Callosobruchus chinensis]